VVVDEKIVLEVKSRNLLFTCPEDYPYPTVAICAVRRWDSREQKPHAFVFVSRRTGVMLSLSTKSFPQWTVEALPDFRRNGWTTRQYCAPTSALLSFDTLVEALHTWAKAAA